MSPSADPARRLSAEDGFTLVELIVAAMILAVGVFALAGTLDSSRHETSAAEAQAAAALVGQRELERLSAQPYATIALAASPGTAGVQTDPRYWVPASCPAGVASPCYQWDESGTATASNTEPLAIDAANADATANPQTWTTPAPNGGDRLSGTLYRFVTWAKDAACGGTCGPGYKRVTVAVTVANSALAHPVVLSTLVGNATGGAANPLTGLGTTCDDGGSAVPCAN